LIREDDELEPNTGRLAFNIGILLVFLSALPLPWLSRDSAEFVVDVIALAISLIFLGLVVWDVRRQVKLTSLPNSKKA